MELLLLSLTLAPLSSLLLLLYMKSFVLPPSLLIFYLLANSLIPHIISFFFLMFALFRTSSSGRRLGRIKLKKAYICCNINQFMVLFLAMYLLSLVFPNLTLLIFGTKDWTILLFYARNFYLDLLQLFPIILYTVGFVLLLNIRGYLFLLVNISLLSL